MRRFFGRILLAIFSFNLHVLALDLAFPTHIIPVMANNPGRFGAFFKTKVSILNPTSFSYPVFVTLYNQNGQVDTRIINLHPNQANNYDNFLAEVFGYGGAGAVRFDSGKGQFSFFVMAEIYTNSPGGRYNTVLTRGSPIEHIGSTLGGYSTSISVSATSRTNIGCFNESVSSQMVQADVHTASGQRLNTYTIKLPQNAWSQISISENVTGGYVRWRPQSLCYCYAVVVDNTSNDGTFLPALSYAP